MRRLVGLAIVVAAAAAGCRGEQGPVGGDLSVRLATPRNSDRGVVLVVTGRVRGASAPAGSGYQVFSDTSADGDTAHVVVVAPRGGGVAAGEIARLRVNDTRQYRKYSARVIALAGASYDPSDTTGVSLTVVKP